MSQMLEMPVIYLTDKRIPSDFCLCYTIWLILKSCIIHLCSKTLLLIDYFAQHLQHIFPFEQLEMQFEHRCQSLRVRSNHLLSTMHLTHTLVGVTSKF